MEARLEEEVEDVLSLGDTIVWAGGVVEWSPVHQRSLLLIVRGAWWRSGWSGR